MPINSALLRVSHTAGMNPAVWPESNTRRRLALAGRFSFSIIVTVLIVLLGTSISAEPKKTRVSLENLSASFQFLAESVGPSVVQVLTTAYAPSPDGSGIVSPRRASGGCLSGPETRAIDVRCLQSRVAQKIARLSREGQGSRPARIRVDPHIKGRG